MRKSNDISLDKDIKLRDILQPTALFRERIHIEWGGCKSRHNIIVIKMQWIHYS